MAELEGGSMSQKEESVKGNIRPISSLSSGVGGKSRKLHISMQDGQE